LAEEVLAESILNFGLLGSSLPRAIEVNRKQDWPEWLFKRADWRHGEVIRRLSLGQRPCGLWRFATDLGNPSEG